ncbi:MAG: hypothetical protein K6F09_07580 [Clostridiales bacterium]|nr:hypothetical protein [Clostridiales bacterium]
MSKRAKNIALFLVMLIVVFMFASALFPTALGHHDCSGEKCAVCMQMHVWYRLTSLFGACLTCFMTFFGVFLFLNVFYRIVFRFFKERTPVKLKNKILD